MNCPLVWSKFRLEMNIFGFYKKLPLGLDRRSLELLFFNVFEP